MRTIVHAICLTAVLACLSHSCAVQAQDAQPAEKKYAFELRGKSWIEVMEWLSGATDMIIFEEHKLKGTFSYVAPRVDGKPRQYTLGEILDILNENLHAQKGMIVRRGTFLALVSTDEKIDFSRLPRLTPAELAKRGRTEPVAVVLPLRTLQSEKIADDVKKLLGPGSELQALPKINALLLCAKAGSVDSVVQIIANLEKPQPRAVPDKKPQGGSKKASDVPAEKKIALAMRNMPWNGVFEWLTDQTGLPIVFMADVRTPPIGGFTLISPTKGKEPSLYSVGEVIDLINEELLARHHLLIRRDGVLLLVAADLKVNPAMVPHVGLSELARRGKTELVSVTLSLKSLGGKEGVGELQQLKGPFGEVIILEHADCVVWQDTAGNLRKIMAITAMQKQAAPDNKGTKKASEKLSEKDLALQFVRLAAITKSDKGYEAVLRNLLVEEDSYVRLRVSPNDVAMAFGDNKKIKLRIRVLRIEARNLYFRRDSVVFVMHLGDSLQETLARPLAPAEVKKLQLPTDK